MGVTRARLGVVMAIVAAPHLVAQSIADRVAAVQEGTVQMSVRVASRRVRRRTGRDGVRQAVHGVSVRAGARVVERWTAVRAVRARDDAARWRGDARPTHIGAVRRGRRRRHGSRHRPCRRGGEYFLGLASSEQGRAASTAIMAAAFADSADIWQQLLALARDENRAHDVRSSALYWLSGVAPADAAAPLATLARIGGESR